MTLKIQSLMFVASLALISSGCAYNKIDEMKTVTPKGSAFYKALHSEYVKQATRETKEEDWINAVKYAGRAIKSAKGGPQYPEAIGNRDLPKGKVGELQHARNRLTAALIQSGRKKAPKPAAHAQVMFDCWMEEQEENHQPKDIAKCRAAFEKSLAKVKKALKKKRKRKAKPAPKPMAKPAKASFIVYFDFNSAKITLASRAVIAKAVRWAKDKRASMVAVNGHTDRAGTNSYNVGLAERRAYAVSGLLLKGGVKAGDLRISASGENKPAVKTADGKREKRNRRVSINLSN